MNKQPTNHWFTDERSQAPVGNHIPEHPQTIPNAYLSPEVLAIVTPYDAFKLCWPDEWVDKVLDESLDYAHKSNQMHRA